MSNFSKCAKLALASAAFLAFSAQAELQTWKLTGTVYQQTENFSGPSFVAIGNTVSVSYVIDTDVAAFYPGLFNAVQTFTVNGVQSTAGGNINAGGSGLNAINVWPAVARADGIDFLSFNRFDGPIATSVTEAVNDFSLATSTGAFVDFRIDFGPQGSAWIKPSSFTQQGVPAHCSKQGPRSKDPHCPH